MRAANRRFHRESPFGSPEAYTPEHLAAKILNSRAALEGERKQVTVLFADSKARWRCWLTSIPRKRASFSIRSSS